MYGGSGASPAGSPSSRSRQRPSPSGSSSSTGPSRCPGRSLRDGRASPSQVPFSPSRSSSSTSASPAARALEPQPRRQHARVVHDDERPLGELGRQLVEAAVPRLAARAVVDEEPRGIPPLGRVLRDQLLAVTRSPARTTSSDPDVTVAADDRRRDRKGARAAPRGRRGPPRRGRGGRRARAGARAGRGAGADGRRARGDDPGAGSSTPSATGSPSRSARSAATSPRSAA